MRVVASQSLEKYDKLPKTNISPKKRIHSPFQQSTSDTKRSETVRSRSDSQSLPKDSLSTHRSHSHSRQRSRSHEKSIHGEVTRISDRGFGFIRPDDGNRGDGRESDIYFHCTGVRGMRFDDLREGDGVTFEVGEDRRTGRSRGENIVPDREVKERRERHRSRDRNYRRRDHSRSRNVCRDRRYRSYSH